eukprot:283337-Chlamydomonas_euryale.AAC.6
MGRAAALQGGKEWVCWMHTRTRPSLIDFFGTEVVCAMMQSLVAEVARAAMQCACECMWEGPELKHQAFAPRGPVALSAKHCLWGREKRFHAREASTSSLKDDIDFG